MTRIAYRLLALAAIAVPVLLTVGAVNYVMGIQSYRVTCQPAGLGDGGWAAAKFSVVPPYRTIEVAVVQEDGGGSPTNPVYLGGSNVQQSNGFPICSTSFCSGKTFSANAQQHELWYMCKRQDGGTSIRVITAR
jgi:hypothetical protein